MTVLQEIADAGLYHPTINSSLSARVAVSYTPADYPTDEMRAAGFVCGCGDYFDNPCRAEFRKVFNLVYVTKFHWSLRCQLDLLHLKSPDRKRRYAQAGLVHGIISLQIAKRGAQVLPCGAGSYQLAQCSF